MCINMLFQGEFMWFREIHFPLQICRFPGAGTLLTNLRLFVKKIFLRSRRAQCDNTRKHKIMKILKNHTKCVIFALFEAFLWWFWEFYIPSQICRFLGAGTFLTNLRLFVKKNFLRSRRAQCDNTKKHKIMKILENHTKCVIFVLF